MQSPARNLALHVSSLVQKGRTDLDGLSDLVRLLTTNAFTYRARKLRDYVGECSIATEATMDMRLNGRNALVTGAVV